MGSRSRPKRARRGRKEVRLQRELSRFLIERGIYAVGTQFGRAETDLVSNERSDYFILEVKKFPHERGITPRNMHAAIVQLQSYMDQHPAHPRGILVVYNLSETLLVAPQTWLRGKYWIVAVNLGKEPQVIGLRAYRLKKAPENRRFQYIGYKEPTAKIAAGCRNGLEGVLDESPEGE